MGKKKRLKKKVLPSLFVALYDHNPENNTSTGEQQPSITPELSKQLSYKRGEILSMISDDLDYWILCKSTVTGKQGYVLTSLLAPLTGAGASVHYTKKEKRKKKKCMVYFPNFPIEKPKPPCPADKANILSKIFFGWVTRLIVDGFKRPLEDSDLWQLQERNTAQYLGLKFEKYWKQEMDKQKNSPIVEKILKQKDEEKKEFRNPDSPKSIKFHKYKPSVSKALFKTCGKPYLVGSFMKILYDCTLFVQPWLLGKTIEVIQNRNIDSKLGYLYASMLFVTGLVGSIILQQYFHISFVTSIRVRSSLLTAVYKKMFRLNNFGRVDFTVGEMVNLMTVDTQKCYDLLTYLNVLWSGPFQIIVSFVYLYLLMGWSILAGFGVLLFFIPISSCFSTFEKKFQAKQMVFKDRRSKFMNEILAGINILKLYSWEDSFIANILRIRNGELKLIKKAMLLQANHGFALTLAPFLVSFLTFLVYVMLGNNLTAEKAFVAISLFNIIRFPLFLLPMVIANIAQFRVSAKRLSKFLKSEELEPVLESDDINSKNAIEICNGTFKWSDTGDAILQNISLKIPCGSLTAIVGQVGSGKSSLVSAILGEIKKVSGEVLVKDSISYVSQQPWIQNRSFRDNITFVSDYESNRYNKVVDACALKPDINSLPGGDRTEIGEKGINLSGGQKQRISIARAVYHNSEIYIMDDPLSAVDAHVGKHIFDQVIGSNGLLNKKTRILVTHNLTYLPLVDQIIVLSDNKISECGSYEELKNNAGAFAEFLKTFHHEVKNDEETYSNELEYEGNEVNAIEGLNVEIIDNKIEPEHALSFTNLAYASNSCVSVFEDLKNDETDKNDEIDENELYKKEAQQILARHEKTVLLKGSEVLITQEVSETGKVKRSVYLTYSKSISILLTILFLFFGLMSEGFSLYSRIWLAEWSSNRNASNHQRDLYLGIYGALGVSQGLSAMLQAVVLCFGVVRASKALHNNLLKNVLRSPMSFFETTPMGRIVNRFSKDINLIDESIPKTIKSFVSCFFTLCGTVFIISYTTPIFLAAFVPIGVAYFFTQRFYVASSRQLQRIESVRRSPIYNHFFESINGASTIRAYRLNDEFISENESKIDFSQEASFPMVCSNRWLAMRLETCGHLITFFAALFSIIQRGNLSPGMVGLSISYALQITQTLNWLVRMSSELETNIVSVERVKEYIDLPSEAAAVIHDSRPQNDWPSAGAIMFQNFCLRYRKDLDLVLKNITFNVEPSSKVGLVGRTGAGKSSIANALFRIIEPASGSILIDNVDISTIGLHDLRSRITIIPQDPVLFSGTLRFNIDPFNQFDDAEIWRVLEISNLKSHVSSLEGGLLHEILEGGENLSVGQRQLVCLARAVLRKSKILVLDEATSSVDLETDAFIQEVIRKEFKSSTVLCIAHRLNTILDYDKIIVLSHGEIIEYDSPKILFQQQGEFYKMMKDAGLSAE
ncbi:multidrug resistance-associated protein 1 isoform X1 [Hydra vulgaris]|uniref:multidrug resistance-associated protein 1 isoform X1 n=1 Tax=Hydra vulgaris TaxID=6087 RepID=UPI001F5F9E07|nr:multidrug resistance-associated protein 1 [Hydra vulgaris]